ncbi:hypothetical protein JHK87_011991 [Glycine soja]|nr:hypothetical protein JHK87_011991 [Glycine soja]
MQQQAKSSNRPRQTRRNINRNREDEHSHLMNDYFSENCKCIIAIHILAYESPINSMDEYVRIGNSTVVERLKAFVKGMNKIFGDEYLRRPNNYDINRLLQIGETPDFPSRAPPVQFTINGTTQNMGYYLVDDIYPNWGILVKTIPMPHGEKKKLFAKCQATRKDVKRAVEMGIMKNIILTCIIFYNMIVENKQNMCSGNVDVDYDHIENEISNIDISWDDHPDFAAYLQTRCYMHTRGVHQQFQTDLVKNI